MRIRLEHNGTVERRPMPEGRFRALCALAEQMEGKQHG